LGAINICTAVAFSVTTGDVTDGAEPIEKEVDSVVGVFWIARRQTDKTGCFGYKQKSENGDVQTGNL